MTTPLPFDINACLEKLTVDTKAWLASKRIENPIIVGIHTGGVWIAQHLHLAIAPDTPLATLDISFYRDDFSTHGLHPKVKGSDLPIAITNQHIVLVDDVFMSGRTARAALNELFDFGRPASVTLITLVDLDNHELPIRPDVTGAVIALQPNQRINIIGPTPLSYQLVEVDSQ